MRGQVMGGQNYQSSDAEPNPATSVAEVICDKFNDMRRTVQNDRGLIAEPQRRWS